MAVSRREFLTWMSAGAGAAALAGCESTGGSAGASDPVPSGARVVVIGGGFGGGSAAKYIKLWAPDIDVVLIERNPQFISCPISNLVLAGNTTMQEITFGYDGLRAHGVRVVRDEVVGIDPDKRQVRLARGATVSY